jgi:hypothetical protein
MPEGNQQQQQQQQPVAMPEVTTSLLSADDYVYEPKAPPGKEGEQEGQSQQSGGMASQFEIVSSPLNKNV